MKMRIMFFGIVLFMALAVSVSAYTPNPTNCSPIDVGCVKDQFGLTTDDHAVDPWTPRKGAILFYGGNGMFQALLYFDSTAVQFYQNNLWAGFEIDIIFPDGGSIPRIDAESVAGPSGTEPLRDTVTAPPWEVPTRGITVIRPSSMNVGWNVFSFQLNDSIPDNTPIKANIQLVASVYPFAVCGEYLCQKQFRVDKQQSPRLGVCC